MKQSIFAGSILRMDPLLCLVTRYCLILAGRMDTPSSEYIWTLRNLHCRRHLLTYGRFVYLLW